MAGASINRKEFFFGDHSDRNNLQRRGKPFDKCVRSSRVSNVIEPAPPHEEEVNYEIGHSYCILARLNLVGYY